MSLAPRLDIRQSQSLVMTPQLQQAIKLLTLSNLEVEAFIAEEVEKNPLLDASAVREVATPERPEREAPAGAVPAKTGASTWITRPRATSRTASPMAARGRTAACR